MGGGWLSRGWERDSNGYFENDDCGYCGGGGSAFEGFEKGGRFGGVGVWRGVGCILWAWVGEGGGLGLDFTSIGVLRYRDDQNHEDGALGKRYAGILGTMREDISIRELKVGYSKAALMIHKSLSFHSTPLPPNPLACFIRPGRILQSSSPARIPDVYTIKRGR